MRLALINVHYYSAQVFQASSAVSIHYKKHKALEFFLQ